ncbi:dipeptide/oligopeptide/nickel ABC transporter permease/ATP-binding protein [Streptomyces sp. NPDC059816]|uniref:dipeptide/oligopeptide/nickel ABC transporter permease/ATP-binding protein n=1 Tax=Streptomyces sp. NPDC059816 TaxID=3346960 RepID=UPI00365D0CA0
MSTHQARAGTLQRLLRQPVTLICLAFLGLQIAIALAAPLIAPYGPNELSVADKLQGPSADHLLGTDDLGRDSLSRLIYGTRTALLASGESVAIGLVLGVGLGIFVGYRGGWWDRIGMRIADVMQSIPALLLALALVAVLGNGLTNAMLAVGLIFAVSFMRITRAVVLAEREKLYVDAARVLGLRPASVMFRQILPNVSPPLIVQASIALGTALLIEATLSFLGVGVDTTAVSWGAMLDASRQHVAEHPLLAILPGAAITLSVLVFNLLGDGLRDAGSPRSAGAARPRKPTTAAAEPTATGPGDPTGTGPAAVTHLTADPVRPAVDAPGAPAPDTAATSGPLAKGPVRLVAREPEPAPADALLRIDGLTVTDPGGAQLVSDVSFHINRGETFGLVGESGCGKSITASAILGLLPRGVTVAAGSIRLQDTELAGLGGEKLRRVRGGRIGMVFQDPGSALSPVHTVGRQLTDAIRAHSDLTRAQAVERAAELLNLVGVPAPRERLKDYPHQFSGGMAQRVVIAGALACDPELLIADEPTTALDVTIQAQVLDLLVSLRERLSMSLLLITHDLGVVADSCDRIAVMYAGQIAEQRTVRDAFAQPRHPYTEALLAAVPHHGAGDEPLATIPGRVPPAWDWPRGCRFNPRCSYATDSCRTTPVPIDIDGVRCLRASELHLAGAR